MNKKLFGLSFFISLMIWFYVMNSEKHVISKDVSVIFRVPSNRSIEHFTNDRITVKIKGTRMFLQQLKDHDLSLDLDGLELKKRNLSFSIDAKEFKLPFGTEIVEINPERIDLKLNHSRTYSKPLIPSFSGQLKEGLVLKSFKIVPSKIKVTGTYENVRSLKGVPTTPIDLEKLDKLGAQKVYPRALDQRYTYDTETPLALEYELDYKKNSFKFQNIPISLGPDVKVLQENKSVTLDVFAPEELGQNLKELDFKAKLIIPPNKKGPIKAKVEIEMPKDVELLRIYPEYIRVFVPQSLGE